MSRVPQQRRRFRRVAKFGAYVLAGVLTSYAVASTLLMTRWESGWRGPSRKYVGLVARGRQSAITGLVEITSSFGFQRISGEVVIPRDDKNVEVLPEGTLLESVLPMEVRRTIVPWGRSRAWPDPDHPEDGAEAVIQYCTGATIVGWPLGCAWSPYEPIDGGVSDEIEIPLPDWVKLQGREPFNTGWCIPYKPIWLGLAGDMAFYALVWFALIRGLHALRSPIRHLKGFCPSCGYPLASLSPGSKCPECVRS